MISRRRNEVRSFGADSRVAALLFFPGCLDFSFLFTPPCRLNHLSDNPCQFCGGCVLGVLGGVSPWRFLVNPFSFSVCLFFFSSFSRFVPIPRHPFLLSRSPPLPPVALLQPGVIVSHTRRLCHLLEWTFSFPPVFVAPHFHCQVRARFSRRSLIEIHPASLLVNPLFFHSPPRISPPTPLPLPRISFSCQKSSLFFSG